MANRRLEEAHFAEHVIKGLGLPFTELSMLKVMSWEQQEGGHWSNSAKYNPLNTTLALPGAGNTGAQGNIKVYRSWQQGIEATIKTLQSPAYAGVRQNLAGSGDRASFESAVNASPWGTKFPGGGKGGGQGSGAGNVPGGEVNLQGGVEGAVKGAVGAVTSTADLIKALTEPETWLRLAEGVGGMVLLAMGLKTLTRGDATAGPLAEAGRQARGAGGVVKKGAEAVALL